MIRCFRCNKEIYKVEDIGRIVRKSCYESYDFCICSGCVNHFDKSAEDDLIEWYRLINAKKGLEGNIIRNGIIKEQEKKSDYEIEIEEGMAALYELEDYGAFSDEGIMPGCHSKYDDCDIAVEKNYAEWANEVCRCITLLRGMYDMTLEKFSEDVNISKDIIEQIDNGRNYDEEPMDIIKEYFYNKIKIESNDRRLPF